MIRLTIAAMALMTPAIAGAPADAARAASLLLGTTGTWEGTLTYLDYQSGEKTALPVTETVALLPDNATLQTIAAYDDGPAGTVFIISLSALNTDTGAWESASFRKGDEMDTGSVALSLPKPPADDTHWTVLTTRDGTDGDSPAVIRHTITRDGATLTTTAEYDRKDDGKDEFAFRNQQVLTLKP
ncbi:MAG: hypothetical protein ABW128_16070 [Rhizorhabdus sp.]